MAHALPGRAPVAIALAPLGLVVLGALLFGGGALTARWRSGHTPRGRVARLLAGAAAGIPRGLAAVPSIARRPAASLGTLAYWSCDCAGLWAALHACGGSPSVEVIVLAYMLGQVGALSPLPGGVGGVEPTMLVVFAACGVNAGLAAGAIVCYRALLLAVQGAAGAIAASLLPG